MIKRILLFFLSVFPVIALSAQEKYSILASRSKDNGDFQGAIAQYEKAISAGEDVYYEIASIYEHNLDDDAKAVEWFRKGAEIANNPYCQSCLADALRDGRGVEQNSREAGLWYIKAAEYWDASSDEYGVEYAFQFYRSASNLGNVTAMRRLADMYRKGRGCDQNLKIAAQWMGLADKVTARQNNDAQANAPATVEKTVEKKETEDVEETVPVEVAEPLRTDTYSYFAKQYVEEKINEWQKKDEFEKTEAWKNRIAKGRDSLVNVYASKAEISFIEKESEKWSFVPGQTLSLGQYDSDNEVFLISHPHFGSLLLAVPIARAPEFKMDWANQQVSSTFYINADTLAVATLKFENPRTNDVFTYSDNKSLNYTVAQVSYNFADIEFTPQAPSRTRVKGDQNISSASVSIGGSDVDINIPEVKFNNDKTFAVIIGNENYQSEGNVEFACNDAVAMGQYCIKTLGMPQSNVRVVTDATLNNMKREINWLTTVSKSYDGEATIIFFYSGHGIPDEADKSSYLLPIDGYGMDVSTGYKLSDVYAQLSQCNSKQSIVLLDACFSGAAKSGEMMHAARGVALKVKEEAAPTRGNLIVLSAATGDETAYPYARQQHGMFTYFLLSKLNTSKGTAKLGEIYDYIKDNVSRKSIVENNKPQTPTCTVTDDLRNSWRNLSFR